MRASLTRRRWLASAIGAGAWSLGASGRATTRPSPRATIRVDDRVVRRAVPAHFLSFNMNVVTLDADHGTRNGAGLRAEVTAAMRAFPGSFYRYPGGNVSNRFAFDQAVGELSRRPPQRLVNHAAAAPVRFGPAEYLRFLEDVAGQGWYTLNLVGWGDDEGVAERTSAEMAEANGRVAAFRARHEPAVAGVRYYHLGNELDRNVYRWPPTKYIQRCRETMAAVRAADPQARFVAFLRDFNLARGLNDTNGLAHARAVLDGLPEVQDVSLQVYYDRAAGEGQRADLTWRWPLIDRFIDALASRPGAPVTVWITEHALARDLGAREQSRRDRLATTSGIDGAVASCDFVIGALQRPAIAATFWHALGGGVWWDLFQPASSPLRHTPVYRALQLYRNAIAGDVFATTVNGSHVSGYSGGYDINAVALGGPRVPSALLVVNRASEQAELGIDWPSLAGCPLTLESVAADTRPAANDPLGYEAGERPVTRDMAAGPVRAVVPARSVSVLRARAC